MIMLVTFSEAGKEKRAARPQAAGQHRANQPSTKMVTLSSAGCGTLTNSMGGFASLATFSGFPTTE
jgi:hypothetical protein